MIRNTLRAGVLLFCLSVSWTSQAADRIPWVTSGFKGTAEAPPPYTTEPIFPAAKFKNPVSIVHSLDWHRYFVLEVDGKLYSFSDDGDGSPELVVDLQKAIPGVQRGYGIAFDPQFQTNRYIYLCYTYERKAPKGTAVARFRMPDTSAPEIDLDSRLEMIHWLSGGHNGGCLKFGPDGLLYISTGDAEAPSPPDRLRTGQDISDLLASILRIDVRNSSPEEPYRIPKDNPFVGWDNAREEIWAYGMRNPWRMSFDRSTGQLWVGDVGWELWEMVYRVEKGGNYGWSVVEGRQPVNQSWPRGPTPILLPMAEHPHSEARSLTGGFVYRGTRLQNLVGHYIYGDYVTGKMWALSAAAEPLSPPTEIANTPIQIIAFGETPSGDLLILDYVNGNIHRLMPNPERDKPGQFPRQLSASGLFAKVSEHRLAPGVEPYQINASPWEDQLEAERFIAIPNGELLGQYARNRFQQGEIKDAWRFPEGSVLGKTLSLPHHITEDGNPRKLETQVLHRYQNRWQAYSYIWNKEQTEAHLAPSEGDTIDLPANLVSSQHRVSSRTECILCHTIQAGSVLGFNEGQLNGRVRHETELARFTRLGYFEKRPRGQKKVFVDPYDPTQDLNQRARSYLHVNCAQCHRFGGGGTAIFDVRYSLSNEETKFFASLPIQGTFGIEGAQIIAPQDPESSLLYYRMSKLGQGRMPHFGAQTIDQRGLEMLRDWIQSLPPKLSLQQDKQASLSALRAQQKQNLAQFQRANNPSSPKAMETLDRVIDRPSGALMLLDRVDSSRSPLPSAHREQAIERASAHADSRISDLFLRFIPKSERTPRLGLTIDLDPILALKGDSRNGENLLHSNPSLRCLECHQLHDKGKQVGPRLDKIGGRLSRVEILRSILDPSASIAPEFAAKLIETEDGDIYSGFLVAETAEEIQFRDINQGLVKIPKFQVLSLDAQTLSLMPQYLLQELTPQEAADLLAFLTTLQ